MSDPLIPAALPPSTDIPPFCPKAEDLKRHSLLFRVHDAYSITIWSLTGGFIAKQFEGTPASRVEAESDAASGAWRQLDPRAHVRHWGSNPNGRTRDYWSERGENGSKWISTTPLWMWAVVECIKRSRFQGRANLSIAVIDMDKVRARAVYSTLQTDDLQAQEWAWHPHEVLIYAFIPTAAILSDIPFTSLIPHLPPYFFVRASVPRGISDIVVFECGKWDRFKYAGEALRRSLGTWRTRESITCTQLASVAFELAQAMLPLRVLELHLKRLEDAYRQILGGESVESVDALSDQLSVLLQLWEPVPAPPALSLLNSEYGMSLQWPLNELAVEQMRSGLDKFETEALQQASSHTSRTRILARKIASWGLDWTGGTAQA